MRKNSIMMKNKISWLGCFLGIVMFWAFPVNAVITMTPENEKVFAIDEEVQLQGKFEGEPNPFDEKECEMCGKTGTWEKVEGEPEFLYEGSGMLGGDNLDTRTPGKKAVDVKVKFKWKCSETDDEEEATEEDTFAYTVVKVEFDSVDEADEIGNHGDVKIYATAQGSDDVTIKLKVNPDDAKIPDDFINWSGGSEGTDPLKRTLSKSTLNEAGEIILSKVNDKYISQSMVYVFKGKPENVDLQIDIKPIPDNSVISNSDKGFGAMVYGNAYKPQNEFYIYYENKKWKFIYTKISYEIKWGLNSQKREDVISGAMNPFPAGLGMSAKTTQKQRKKQAKRDLTPFGIGFAPRDSYWSSECTTEHEKFHINDWQEYHSKGLKKAAKKIAAIEIDVDIYNPNPNKILENKNHDLWQIIFEETEDADKDYSSKCEARAFAAVKDKYQSLANSIKP